LFWPNFITITKKIRTCYQASRPLERVGPVCLLSDVDVYLFKRRGTSFACTSRQRGLKSDGNIHPVKDRNKFCIQVLAGRFKK